MKNKRLLKSFDFIDDKYVKEAEPKMKVSKAPTAKIWARVACFAIVIALSLYLFIPFSTKGPRLTAYEDSDYFPIIEKIANYRYKPNPYKNNFQYLTAEISGLFNSFSKGGAMAPNIDESEGGTMNDGAVPGDQGNGSYVETTDNQVAGVIEADLMKRTENYIFRLSEDSLKVYDINKEQTQKITEFEIPHLVDDYQRSYAYTNMYLSEDANTIIVVALYAKSNILYTDTCKVGVTALDVSDIGNIQVKKSIVVDGKYNTSRMVDGKLILINDYVINAYGIDYSNPETFVPKITDGDVTQCIKFEDIIYPDKINSTGYSIVTLMDLSSLELLSSNALLDYYNDIYVSESNVYVTKEYTKKEEIGQNGSYKNTAMCDIVVLDYSGEALKYKGTLTVEGSVKDQYSMDEYNGYFRVVTSTNEQTIRAYNNGKYDDTVSSARLFSASLTVFNLESLEQIAVVKNFAPNGEEAKSVRIDKDVAYVCTAVTLTYTDPVFYFDLSDYSNITYTDTGVINGFSSSLIQLGNGYLLGIGKESWVEDKIEVYVEEDGKVVSVAKYVFTGSCTEEYKAYFIDRQNNTVGIPVSGFIVESGDNYAMYKDGYLLFTFNGDGYSTRFIVKDLYLRPDRVRAFADDGYLYITTDKSITVKKIYE